MPFQKLVIWKSSGERDYILVFISNKMNKELFEDKNEKGWGRRKKGKARGWGKKNPTLLFKQIITYTFLVVLNIWKFYAMNLKMF